MTYLLVWLSSFTRRDEGQGLAEYALILALIAIVTILALTFLGRQISTILSYIGSVISPPIVTNEPTPGLAGRPAAGGRESSSEEVLLHHDVSGELAVRSYSS